MSSGSRPSRSSVRSLSCLRVSRHGSVPRRGPTLCLTPRRVVTVGTVRVVLPSWPRAAVVFGSRRPRYTCGTGGSRTCVTTGVRCLPLGLLVVTLGMDPVWSSSGWHESGTRGQGLVRRRGSVCPSTVRQDLRCPDEGLCLRVSGRLQLVSVIHEQAVNPLCLMSYFFE